MEMNELTNKIKEWAMARDLHSNDPNKQMYKLGEEHGELCEGMAKNDTELTVDAIGDMYVVLTILAMQLGLSIEDCVSYAYDQIKNRTGKTVNGVFIKSEDLK